MTIAAAVPGPLGRLHARPAGTRCSRRIEYTVVELRRRGAARPRRRAAAAEPSCGRCGCVAAVYTELFKNVPLLAIIFLTYFGLASVGRAAQRLRGRLPEPDHLLRRLPVGDLPRRDQRACTPASRRRPRRSAWAGARPSCTSSSRRRCGSALPGTNTMLVDLLKSTSLLVTISAAELMSEGRLITSATFRALEVYLVIAVHLLRALLPALAGAAAGSSARSAPACPCAPSPAPAARGARCSRGEAPHDAIAQKPVPQATTDGGAAVDRHRRRRRADRRAAQVLRRPPRARRRRPGGPPRQDRRASSAQSGGGKTTLMRCVNLLERPDRAARIEVAGEPVFDGDAHGLPRPAPAAPDGRHGLPALQPLPAPDRGGERDAGAAARRACPRAARRSSAP